jgi:hypothetical protein
MTAAGLERLYRKSVDCGRLEGLEAVYLTAYLGASRQKAMPA